MVLEIVENAQEAVGQELASEDCEPLTEEHLPTEPIF